MSGTKPRSGSLGHRMAAFFTPTKNNNSSRRDNSAEEQTEQEQTNLQQQQQQPPPSSSMSSPSPSPSSSSSSSSSSFLGTLRARASAALASRRFESSERQAAKAGGIEKINSKMYHAIQKEEEMGKDKQIQTLEALDFYLSTYHGGRYLLLDVSRSLSSIDKSINDRLFRSSRINIEFDRHNDTLGTLDTAARIAAAAKRWWAADETRNEHESKNIVVLLCDSNTSKMILATCALFEGMEFTNIMNAYHHVLLSSENRLMASLHLRSLLPNHKKFLNDYELIHRYDRNFQVPKVWLHELRIHRLPQFEEDGTRLLIVIIANGNQFLYTSQAQGGGHVMIPTTRDDPLTVCIPLAVQFAGDASVKVWHLPEHTNVNNPRQLIFETRIHSALLCLPCWNMTERGVIEPTPTPTPAVPAVAVAPTPLQPTPLPALVPTEENIGQTVYGVEAVPFGSAIPAPTPAPAVHAPAAAATTPTPVVTYPLHRVFIRQDELELHAPEVDMSATTQMMMQMDVEYHKNFRVSITCTPMEEVKYRQIKEEATPQQTQVNHTNNAPSSSSSAAAAASSSSSSSSHPISILSEPLLAPSRDSIQPSSGSPPEVDLHQLAAQWNGGLGGASSSSSVDLADAADDDLVSPLSASRQSLPASSSDSSATVTFDTPPPRAVTRTPSNSSADMHAPTQPTEQATPARRKRTESGASSMSPPTASSSSSSPSSVSPFVPPALTVPPLARSTAGIRYYPEDKHGAERAETPEEANARLKIQLERQELDAIYGAGHWRKQNGVIYTLPGAGSHHQQQQPHAIQYIQSQLGANQAYIMQHPITIIQPSQYQQQQQQQSQSQQMEADAHRNQQLQQQQQQQQQQQRAYELQQQQQHELHAAAQAARAAELQSDIAACQSILDSPDASVSAKDEALARMLAAQFAQEDLTLAQQAHQQQQLHAQQAHAAQAQAMVEAQLARAAAAAAAATPGGSAAPSSAGSSSRNRSSRSRRSHTSSSRSSAAAVSVRADGSIVVAAANSAESESPGELDDESLARAMQRQFDLESSSRPDRSNGGVGGMSALVAAQGSLDPDRLQYDQRLALEELMGPVRSSRNGRTGASRQQIEQLPEFQLSGTSKYLQEECQICQESFLQHDVLRQLQCIHAYHSACIDPWLRTNATCPCCKMPIH